MRVEEKHLDWDKFNCCGDENLCPIKCSNCNHIMVFCYELDTLYPDLTDLSNIQGVFNIAVHCPKCEYQFERPVMENPAYHVTLEEWIVGGYGNLLLSPDHGDQ